jgi:hypothetical protein
VTAEIHVPEVANHVPHVRITWNADEKKITTRDVITTMRDGEPSIRVRGGRQGLDIGVWMMKPGEAKIVATRLRRVLEGKERILTS